MRPPPDLLHQLKGFRPLSAIKPSSSKGCLKPGARFVAEAEGLVVGVVIDAVGKPPVRAYWRVASIFDMAPWAGRKIAALTPKVFAQGRRLGMVPAEQATTPLFPLRLERARNLK
jgi:hypothetical protein